MFSDRSPSNNLSAFLCALLLVTCYLHSVFFLDMIISLRVDYSVCNVSSSSVSFFPGS